MPPSPSESELPEPLEVETDVMQGAPVVEDEPESRPGGVPLYVWVVAAVIVAIPVGLFWGEGATSLEILPRLILRALTALAAPLVVLAILQRDRHQRDPRPPGGADDGLLPDQHAGRHGHRPDASRTWSSPGLGASLAEPGRGRPAAGRGSRSPTCSIELVPRSIGEAFAQNNLAQLVLLTLALGIGLVQDPRRPASAGARPRSRRSSTCWRSASSC